MSLLVCHREGILPAHVKVSVVLGGVAKIGTLAAKVAKPGCSPATYLWLPFTPLRIFTADPERVFAPIMAAF